MIYKDKIQQEWEKDSNIDANRIDEESLNISQHHAKYLKYLNRVRDKRREKIVELKNYKRNLYAYYSGTMSTQELSNLGWHPYPHKVLKNDLSNHVNSEPYVVEIQNEIDELEETIEMIQSILESISRRTFQIKNYIEWQKFINGVI